MEFRGAYDSSVTYNVGDVVKSDLAWYMLQKPANAGTAPQDSLYWGRVSGTLADAAELVDDAVNGVSSEINEAKEAAEDAKDAAEEAAASASAAYGTDLLADDYSTSGKYAVGDYVIHSGGLYRCTTAIASGETWTAAHWAEVAIADDVSSLKIGNLLPDKATGTSGGLTFTRVGYGHFIVNGTSSGATMFNVLSSSTALPQKIKRGRKYLLKFFTTNVNLAARVYLYYTAGSDPSDERIYSGTRGCEFVVPDNTVGIVVRIFCGTAAVCVNEHVEIALYDSESIIGHEKKHYIWAPRPMLTICDDDGRVLFYEQILPLVKETGVPIASANTILRTEIREATDALYKGREDYAAGRITSEELQAIQDHFDAVRAEAKVSTYPENYGIRFMNWDQIRDCHANGAEIVSHTYGHFVEAEDMDMPENVVRGMYIKARHILEMHGIPCKCVVYAGPSDSNVKTRRCASYAFDYGVRASGEQLNYVNGDPMQIRRYGIGGDLTPFESSDIIELVSGLLSIPTGWMILNIHTSSDEWDISKVEVLRDVITYCQTNNIPIVTYAVATHWYYELGCQPGVISDAESQGIL